MKTKNKDTNKKINYFGTSFLRPHFLNCQKNTNTINNLLRYFNKKNYKFDLNIKKIY